MSDIFKEIKEMAEAAVAKARAGRFSKQYRDGVNSRKEYYRDLEAASLECGAFYSDPRYPIQKKFLEDTKKDLTGYLVNICGNTKTKDEQVLLAARLAAQIDFIDALAQRPKRIVEALEAARKEAEKSVL